MNIISLNFLLTVLGIYILYYVFPNKYKWTVLFIGTVGMIISMNGIKLAIVMFIITIFTWLIGLLIDKNREKKLIILSVFILISCLIFFKEINFFTGTTRAIGNFFGKKIDIKNINICAPIGISYWALTLISYLLDVYWELGKVEKNLAKFILFAGYYPILTSGPILRYREMSDILYKCTKPTYIDLCHGAQRTLWGYFKKLVIADRLAVIVNVVYGDFYTYSGFYIWIAVICFVLQLYSDFSGCIDIALGISEMFGIKLPENFELPFMSLNLSEFWRRWHITLGGWLRDYVLYPILNTNAWNKMTHKIKKKFGKKYSKKIPVWIALLISWFVIGFWHGGAWNYIIGVGLYFGVLIIAGEAMEPIFKKVICLLKINTNCYSYRLFQRVRTFILFSIGLSFFRSYGGFLEGIKMYKSAIGNFNPEILMNGELLKLGLDKLEFAILILALLILILASIIRILVGKPVRFWLDDQNMIFRWLVWIALIIVVVIFGNYGPGVNSAEFIYQQF